MTKMAEAAKKLGLISFYLTVSLLLAAAGGDTAPQKKSAPIKNGSKVSIHYTLTVDGQVVDSSIGKEPLTYVQGTGQIIPGLEEEVSLLKKGDKKEVTVTPLKGYGPVNPKAFQKVPRKSFEKMKNLKVGDVVNGQIGGQPVRAIVSKISKEEVTLNLNHPLAGKTLKFNIEVINIQNSL